MNPTDTPAEPEPVFLKHSEPPRRPFVPAVGPGRVRPSIMLSALAMASSLAFYPPGGPPLDRSFGPPAKPVQRKTKQDLERLVAARLKRLKRAEKLAARRGCSLSEVVESERDLRDLRVVPYWALQHSIEVPSVTAVGILPLPVEGVGAGTYEPSAEEEVDPGFL